MTADYNHKTHPVFDIDFELKETSLGRTKTPPEKIQKLILGGEFQVILKVLSIFGNSPLLYNKKEGKYEFRWSWKTLITFFASFLSIFMWTTRVLDLGFNIQIFSFRFQNTLEEVGELIKADSNTTTSMKSLLFWAITNAVMMFSVAQIVDIFFGYFEQKKLGEFLNNWRPFHQDYVKNFPETISAVCSEKQKCFNESSAFEDFSTKNNLAFEPERNFFFANSKFGFRMKKTNFIVTFFLVLAVFGITILAMRVATGSLGHFLFFLILLLRVVVVESIEDIKVVYMLKDVAEAFARIRLGIAQRTRQKDGEMRKLTSEEVKNWRQLIEKARNQSVLAGKSIQLSQLFFLGRSIFVITSYAILVLNIPKTDPRSYGFVLNWFMAALYQTLRVFFKIYVAERITIHESLIAKELSMIEAEIVEEKTLVELKFTHDVISQNSSKISFGNFTILNKSLLLRMFNQIVTYIIVVMQFVS